MEVTRRRCVRPRRLSPFPGPRRRSACQASGRAPLSPSLSPSPRPPLSPPPPQARSAPEWPQWRGPNRDAVAKESGLLTQWPEAGPPLAWKATGLGGGFSSLAIAGGRIFTLGDRQGSQQVVAMNLADGKIALDGQGRPHLGGRVRRPARHADRRRRPGLRARHRGRPGLPATPRPARRSGGRTWRATSAAG